MTTVFIQIDTTVADEWQRRWHEEFQDRWRRADGRPEGSVTQLYVPREQPAEECPVTPRSALATVLALEIQINGHVLSTPKE